jgi:hypothetical protein
MNFEQEVERFAGLPVGREWQSINRKSADAHLVPILPINSTPLVPNASENNGASQAAALKRFAAAWKAVDGSIDPRCAYCLFIKESGWSGQGSHHFNSFNMKCASVIYGTPELIRDRKIWSGVREAVGIYVVTDRVNSFDAYTAFASHDTYAKYAHRVLSRSYPATIRGWRTGGIDGLIEAEKALARGDWSGAPESARESGARGYWARMLRNVPNFGDRNAW